MKPHAAVAAAAVILSLGGCSSSSHTAKTIRVGANTVPTSDLRDVVPGLCATQRTADQTAARSSFYNRSHTGLHVIAQALEAGNRTLAGRLLISMQKVEADLAAANEPLARPHDVAQLVQTTRTGLARLSVPAADCGKD
jgi:hypothetical protein